MPFRVAASRFEEGPGGVLVNARGKAREVAERLGVPANGAVLGADTDVVVDGRPLGKPGDAAEARRMLRLLSGRQHEVHSAVSLVTAGGRRHEALDVSVVRIRALGEGAIDWYLGTGEWRDRAGGYAIQGAGAALVERLEGDYTTVVGLPVGALVTVLVELGLGPWPPGGGQATHRG